MLKHNNWFLKCSGTIVEATGVERRKDKPEWLLSISATTPYKLDYRSLYKGL
ncbi:hypothetical protein ACT29H_12550 [Thermophagus sp. OGC60D27]|uniref:hypothetical protein n=1 Tax=Thermophagus sp. OGC60D27 TaxID=3458415 RepID=UPI0040378846